MRLKAFSLTRLKIEKCPHFNDHINLWDNIFDFFLSFIHVARKPLDRVVNHLRNRLIVSWLCWWVIRLTYIIEEDVKGVGLIITTRYHYSESCDDFNTYWESGNVRARAIGGYLRT
ncbi:hypothetical protein A8140_16735 [Vibrio campbellii CAIM 519 = NBRC 15631 = ATCC 25920]|nr:hypothetical protein A8140_16735 [Vibrio campbellii CAIM 519 = NBRC 15631 = ATCC 25920]ELU49833.1 hypothetical protein B878_21249 [Vibrio campbellii CAIM 519 = NBRC 15631 = ATCC 25920]